MGRVAIIFFELGIVKNSCKNFNRKTLHDYVFFLIMLDCNSFIYKQNCLSDARLMKNTEKTNI